MGALQKYLAAHAEPETRVAALLAEAAAAPFTRAIAIPACGEAPSFLADLETARAERKRVLFIIVVNGVAGDADTAAANAVLLSALGEDAIALGDTHASWRASDGLLVVDRATGGRHVPRKQAVGLARKIAGDITAALFAEGALESRWIHMTDCDVRLPKDYLDADIENAVLMTHRFRHVAGEEGAEVNQAHFIYEAFLRYYVLGLRAAGSRYAMHTIGSTLSADVNAYAAVRGMPRRDAAEDFYLVNKIAKLGRVATPRTSPIEIVARRSLRVPFGTGRSTAKIAEHGGRAFYHPDIFAVVGAFLRGIDVLADGGDSATAAALESLDDEAHRTHLARALTVLDAEASLGKALSSAPKNPAARRQRAHEHFDAFRTRKLVHLLRDGGMGELPWREALEQAPFAGTTMPKDAFDVCRALEGLEVSAAR